MLKFILKLVFPVIIFVPAWNNTFNDYEWNEAADSREWVKDVTRKYSPDSWELLMRYESLPVKQEAGGSDGGTIITRKSVSTFYYLKGRNRIDLLSSMADDIHEIAHGYSDQNIFRYAREKRLKLDLDKAEEFLYFSPSWSFFISFPLKLLFPSRELKADIPGSLRTFRFETYINGSTSTQAEGIIGLLNELHSYYLESKFCFEMIEPYKEAGGSEATGLFEWVYHSQSKMTAFYEFDFFIREYLLHMKRKYPSGYKKLLDYKPFTEAYKAIRTSYKELIDDYLRKIHAEMTSINASGNAEVSMDGFRLWISEAGRDANIGTPVFSADRETLMPVLESDRYQDITTDLPGLGFN